MSSSSNDSVDVSRGFLDAAASDRNSNSNADGVSSSEQPPTTSTVVLRERHDSSSSFSSGVPSEIEEQDEQPPSNSTPAHPQESNLIRIPPDLNSRSHSRHQRDVAKSRPRISVPGIADETTSPVKSEEEGVARKRRNSLPGPGSKEMCKLVVDYLISEGYKEAAEILCTEAKIELPVDDIKSLDSRVAIRDAIIDGNIEDAIQKVTDLCPGLMDDNHDVRFHLLLQNIIEMIRQKDSEKALAYAQEHLSSESELSEEQLSRLEKTFALLAFESPDESPFSALLSQSQRQMVSTEVNSAVLHALNRPAAPRLEALLRMVVWAQTQLLEREGSQDKVDTVMLARGLFSGTQI